MEKGRKIQTIIKIGIYRIFIVHWISYFDWSTKLKVSKYVFFKCALNSRGTSCKKTQSFLPLCMIKDCWDLLGTEDESKARDRCTTHYQGNLKILGMILWKFDIYFLRFDNIAATKLAQKNGGQGPIQWRAKV